MKMRATLVDENEGDTGEGNTVDENEGDTGG